MSRPFLKRWPVVLSLVAVLGACEGSTEQPEQPPPPTVPPTTPPDAGAPDAGMGPDPAAIARGEALFQRHCAVCHPGGEQGVGPSLKTSTTTAAQIHSQVRNGVGVMPPFPPSMISDAELDDLIAYVMSLRTQ